MAPPKCQQILIRNGRFTHGDFEVLAIREIGPCSTREYVQRGAQIVQIYV
jgi:hypothetical protein